MDSKTSFACLDCGKNFIVRGDEDLLRKCVSESVECPYCGITLKLGREKDCVEEAFEVEEFWRAAHGFGLPEEVVAGPEAIEALLLAHRVSSVDVRKTVTGRVEVRTLTLANGVKIHFTSSGEGAVIFKTTKEKNDGSSS